MLRGQADLVNSFGRTVAPRRHRERRRRGARAVGGLRHQLRAWDNFDRWVATMRAERLGTTSSQYLPADLRVLRRRVRSLRFVGLPAQLRRLRLVSARERRMASVLGRALVVLRQLRLVLGRRRSLVVADASLRPLGALRRTGGTGCPIGAGRRPGSPGAARPATRAGVRSASMAGRSSRFSSVRYADPWAAWTVVPARVFANNLVVSQHVVNYRGIAPNVRSQFEVRRAPVGGAYSSTRVQPLRAPTMGRGAVS